VAEPNEVAAEGDAVAVDQTGEVARGRQQLVDHEADVAGLVHVVVAEGDALPAERERRQDDDVARFGPADGSTSVRPSRPTS
jgi:hypothetical protein